MILEVIVGIVLVVCLVIFLKLSSITINGKKIMSLPMRVIISLLFPIFLVLLFVFSSVLILLVIGIVFVAFFVGFVLYFFRKFSRKKEYEDVIVIKRKK
jgi:hypothetical protein